MVWKIYPILGKVISINVGLNLRTLSKGIFCGNYIVPDGVSVSEGYVLSLAFDTDWTEKISLLNIKNQVVLDIWTVDDEKNVVL